MCARWCAILLTSSLVDATYAALVCVSCGDAMLGRQKAQICADLCCTQCASSRGKMHHLAVAIAHPAGSLRQLSSADKHHNNHMACSSLRQLCHEVHQHNLPPELCHHQWLQQNSSCRLLNVYVVLI